MRKSIRFLSLFAAVAVILSAMFVGQPSAHAGGSGGLSVQLVQVCRNGVRFTATATDPNALHRVMYAELYPGHVGVATAPIISGNHHTFNHVGQTRHFVIHFAKGTYAVGDLVTYSAISHDGSGFGGGQFSTVADCLI